MPHLGGFLCGDEEVRVLARALSRGAPCASALKEVTVYDARPEAMEQLSQAIPQAVIKVEDNSDILY